MTRERPDRTARVGAVVGAACSLAIVGVALVVGVRAATPAVVACPDVAWGSSVEVTTTGDAERVDRVEVVPVGTAETPPPSAPAGGSVESSMLDVGTGVAWETVDGRWSVISWGGSSDPTGGFASGRGLVRAWSADDELLVSLDTALDFVRTDGGDDACGGPMEARVAVDVPPDA